MKQGSDITNHHSNESLMFYLSNMASSLFKQTIGKKIDISTSFKQAFKR